MQIFRNFMAKDKVYCFIFLILELTILWMFLTLPLPNFGGNFSFFFIFIGPLCSMWFQFQEFLLRAGAGEPYSERSCSLQIHYFADLLVSHPVDTQLLLLCIHPQRQACDLPPPAFTLWSVAYLVPSLVVQYMLFIGFWFFNLVVLSVFM